MIAVLKVNIIVTTLPSSECIKAASELLSRMDTKADPCEDFYQVDFNIFMFV